MTLNPSSSTSQMLRLKGGVTNLWEFPYLYHLFFFPLPPPSPFPVFSLLSPTSLLSLHPGCQIRISLYTPASLELFTLGCHLARCLHFSNSKSASWIPHCPHYRHRDLPWIPHCNLITRHHDLPRHPPLSPITVHCYLPCGCRDHVLHGFPSSLLSLKFNYHGKIDIVLPCGLDPGLYVV